MTAGRITNVPTRKHTWQSEVRMSVLPTIVDGLLRRRGDVQARPRHREVRRRTARCQRRSRK